MQWNVKSYGPISPKSTVTQFFFWWHKMESQGFVLEDLLKVHDNPNLKTIGLWDAEKEEVEDLFSFTRNEPTVFMPFDPRFVTTEGQPFWSFVYYFLSTKLTTASELRQVVNLLRQKGYEGQSRPSRCDAISSDALETFIEQYLSEDERIHFFYHTLPFIQALALSLPDLFPSPLHFLTQNSTNKHTLSTKQLASLLANAFFCTIPPQKFGEERFPYFNFSGQTSSIHLAGLYDTTFAEWGDEQAAKLKCILHYFSELASSPSRLENTVSFCRKSFPLSPDWEKNETRFVPGTLKVVGGFENKLEDMKNHAHVDFANCSFGGGVFRRSAIQEQILILISPEVIPGMLFTSVLLDHESLVIRGYDRFSDYSGYSGSFRWTGNHASLSDGTGKIKSEMVVIDAIDFRLLSSSDMQFEKQYVYRELGKLYAGFVNDDSEGLEWIATGNWGAGAFAGNVQLKAMLQLVAATVCHRSLLYCCFEQKSLKEKLEKVYERLTADAFRVDDVVKIILEYPETQESTDLLDFILLRLSQVKRVCE
eukprot:TRINITY_DN7258_c0_g1_i1.p1 TRINITY_DN7258_c0_g1~~TRINITY_DN7258_c0_g1_i1.p1  ORF type:complete len:536 (-),score=80.49 TRINITY_DN7258_c0_g1_i1:89-1696(-)